MKKFGLLVVGGIAAIILLANVGPLVGMLISLVIMYYAFKGYMKSSSTGSKLLWTIFGLIGLISAISNAPAILGIVAAYILYVVYKKLTNEEVKKSHDDDPFTNFEKEWTELKKNF